MTGRYGRHMRPATTTALAAALAVAVVAARAGARRRAGFVRNSVASRNGRLAAIGIRTGTRQAVHRVRRATASPERRTELDAAHQIRTADDVARTLGELKGALMKLGQMASYLDDGLAQPVREALAALQQDAPPMAPELTAQIVREQLGGAPDRVFAQWDPTPIAAASIGQVHRAVTRSGLHVAVKVQYPGIDDAIRADLVNTDVVFRALGFLFPGFEPGPLVEELRARLVEELDYGIEADNQRLFADWYADHPFIRVPNVIEELSTRRVLTTELAAGSRFAEVENWAQDERDAAAEAIFRFVFRSIYRLHAFNGDPHPGNYLFRSGGQVTFLDFGLVKRFTPDEVDLFQSLIVAFVIDRDVPRFRRVLEANDVLKPSAIPDDDANTSATSTNSCSTIAKSRSHPNTRRRPSGGCSTGRARTRTSRSCRTCRPRSSSRSASTSDCMRCSVGCARGATGAASRSSSGPSSTDSRRHPWVKPRLRGSTPIPAECSRSRQFT